ncbi:MAG: hypothetical protein IPN18_17715 [Ignavibacteriales bacterium]|nr:hypothetical protein [Ignavibacteriales bacterium]
MRFGWFAGLSGWFSFQNGRQNKSAIPFQKELWVFPSLLSSRKNLFDDLPISPLMIRVSSIGHYSNLSGGHNMPFPSAIPQNEKTKYNS